jgi:hypothetical protein
LEVEKTAFQMQIKCKLSQVEATNLCSHDYPQFNH